MAHDNSRVAHAFLIIAREHSGCSTRWERTLSRRLAIATAAAGSWKALPDSSNRRFIQIFIFLSFGLYNGRRHCLSAALLSTATRAEDNVKRLQNLVTSGLTLLALLGAMPAVSNAQMSKVRTVWVILMENHNWTGNNAGAAFGEGDELYVKSRKLL
jgi:hypothetical protein